MTVSIVNDSSFDMHEFNEVDLYETSSSTLVPENNTKTQQDGLTADKLLDELPLPQQLSYLNHSTSTSSKNNYDQFFEEVSLDLPRDSTQESNSNSSPSRLMKFMPRRGNSLNTTVNNNKSSHNSRRNSSIDGLNKNIDTNMKITSLDISGPFYSISDVLDDHISSAPALNRSSSMRTDYSHSKMNPRAARRNVNEAEVVVTSGGSSIPVKGRSR